MLSDETELSHIETSIDVAQKSWAGFLAALWIYTFKEIAWNYNTPLIYPDKTYPRSKPQEPYNPRLYKWELFCLGKLIRIKVKGGNSHMLFPINSLQGFILESDCPLAKRAELIRSQTGNKGKYFRIILIYMGRCFSKIKSSFVEGNSAVDQAAKL